MTDDGTKGYGWRARIGYISPAVIELMVFDFYRFAPEGVGFVGVSENTNTWSDEDIDKTLAGSVDLAAYLGSRGVDYIVHAGAAHLASKGLGYESGFLDRLHKAGDVPVTTSIRSALRAFRQMGMARVAVASPWPDRITGWVVDYLRADGIEVDHVAAFGTDFKDLHTMKPRQIHDLAVEVASAAPEADGLYIPGPQAPAAMAVDGIERAIGKPVIAGTPADFWAAFADLGITDPIEGHGRLLASLSQG